MDWIVKLNVIRGLFFRIEYHQATINLEVQPCVPFHAATLARCYRSPYWKSSSSRRYTNVCVSILCVYSFVSATLLATSATRDESKLRV